MRELIEKLSELLTQSYYVSTCYRIQNFKSGFHKMEVFCKNFMEIISLVENNKSELAQLGYTLDDNYVAYSLSCVMDAQEKRDYVLVADLLELQIVPFLNNLQELLVSNYSIEVNYDLFERNITGLKKKNANLANLISDCTGSPGVALEMTSSGYATIKMNDDTGEYYYHSNSNPKIEGTQWAMQYYDINCEYYVIYGMGLGYHIQAMLNIDDGINIDIYENDLNILYITCQYMNLSWLYNNDRIRLFYDNEFQSFSGSLGENKTLLIHYPSLRHTSNEKAKLYLEKYFISDSGKRNMEIMFVNNFRDNVRNCTAYVDELTDIFKDKKAIIVAAGPSLDKNIENLRNISENILIIAVGTVFRKMIKLNIIPDYVVFLDAQSHLINQIADIENQKIPIICASTACKGIASRYQGKKYLMCQNGYSRAQEYAKMNGYQLYETGGSVSTIALDLCIKLGCKEIAYIGLDLAYTENRTHTDGANDYIVCEEENAVRVLDINGKDVYASHLFIMYREWIERYVKELSPDIVVYDATEGGALKKGLIKISLKELLQKWGSYK